MVIFVNPKMKPLGRSQRAVDFSIQMGKSSTNMGNHEDIRGYTTRGAPVYESVQLVQITPISLWFMVPITIVFMGVINHLTSLGGPTLYELQLDNSNPVHSWMDAIMDAIYANTLRTIQSQVLFQKPILEVPTMCKVLQGLCKSYVKEYRKNCLIW